VHIVWKAVDSQGSQIIFLKIEREVVADLDRRLFLLNLLLNFIIMYDIYVVGGYTYMSWGYDKYVYPSLSSS
jgi:hypothetical protein